MSIIYILSAYVGLWFPMHSRESCFFTEIVVLFQFWAHSAKFLINLQFSKGYWAFPVRPLLLSPLPLLSSLMVLFLGYSPSFSFPFFLFPSLRASFSSVPFPSFFSHISLHSLTFPAKSLRTWTVSRVWEPCWGMGQYFWRLGHGEQVADRRNVVETQIEI